MIIAQIANITDKDGNTMLHLCGQHYFLWQPIRPLVDAGAIIDAIREKVNCKLVKNYCK